MKHRIQKLELYLPQGKLTLIIVKSRVCESCTTYTDSTKDPGVFTDSKLYFQLFNYTLPHSISLLGLVHTVMFS